MKMCLKLLLFKKQPQSVDYTVIPAEYETYQETVVVQEASTELVTIPPVFETVTETVVVQEASTEDCI